jgi:hypothetical protein
MFATPEGTMEQDALRHLIRDKLADGRLPHNSNPRAWGGPGNNGMCLACESVIAKNEFVVEGIGEAVKAVQFHVRCFYDWDAEREPPGRQLSHAMSSSDHTARQPPSRA